MTAQVPGSLPPTRRPRLSSRLGVSGAGPWLLQEFGERTSASRQAPTAPLHFHSLSAPRPTGRRRPTDAREQTTAGDGAVTLCMTRSRPDFRVTQGLNVQGVKTQTREDARDEGRVETTQVPAAGVCGSKTEDARAGGAEGAEHPLGGPVSVPATLRPTQPPATRRQGRRPRGRAGSSPACCGHLGSELDRSLSLSVSHSAFQINKPFN